MAVEGNTAVKKESITLRIFHVGDFTQSLKNRYYNH